MATFVIVGTILNLIVGWAWYTYLFPQAQTEFGGKPTGRQIFIYIIALALFAAAFATVLLNRRILGTADALRWGFKVWAGFLVPVGLSWWATTRKSFWVLIADVGNWLVVTVLLAFLAAWMLF